MNAKTVKLDWVTSEALAALHHDSIPICKASVDAIVAVISAKADGCDELEVAYLENEMLSVFNTLLN